MDKRNPCKQAHHGDAQVSHPETITEASSKSNTTQPSQQSAKKNYNAETRVLKFFIGLYDFWFRDKAGAWTAASTVAMCIFSAELWHVSDVANKNNFTSQRAYLSVYGPINERITSPDGTAIVSYNFRYTMGNTGRTAAKDGIVHFSYAAGYGSPNSANFANLPVINMTHFVLGPTGSLQFKAVNVSQQELEDIAAGKKRFFLWGWVTYKDGFPDTPTRLTEFCTDVVKVAWLTPSHTDPAKTTIYFDWPPCDTHNCFDEDCPDYQEKTKSL